MTDSGSSPSLILLESPISSFVQKIKILLREKSIPFTVQAPSDLAAALPSGPLRTANPRVEVPTLLHGDLSIWDSTIILEYLEDAFPQHPMRSDNAFARAQDRMIEDICDQEYEGTNWGVGEIKVFDRGEFDKELQTVILAKAAEYIKEIQVWLGDKLGDREFFGGDRFGYADCCVAPFVNRSRVQEMGIADDRLARWLERVQGRESVRKTFEEFDKAYPAMPKMKALFASGQRKRQYRSSRLEFLIKSGGMSIVEDGIKNDTIKFSWPGDLATA